MASSFLIYIPYEADEDELDGKSVEERNDSNDNKETNASLNNGRIDSTENTENKSDVALSNTSNSVQNSPTRSLPRQYSEKSHLLNQKHLVRNGSTQQDREAEAGMERANVPSDAVPRSMSKKSMDKVRFEVTPAATAVDDEAGGGKDSRNPSVVTMLANIDDAELQEVTTEVLTLRDALRELLARLDIDNDIWNRTDDGNEWQINFVVKSQLCDKVLHSITGAGFGRIAETSVSVFSASFHYSGLPNRDLESSTESSQKKEFIRSIKSRLTVAQVVGAVKSNATLTFDFLVLILLASMIAGFGLAENSSVSLVASMLISPLMGPIMGFTFGVVVENSELWRLGVRNELIGLTVCLSYGFLFGLVSGVVNSTGANWGATDAWPTAEMRSRGLLRSLWVGVLIALPSGAGVALSILGGNTGSLVGVAISASLLPPAVNAGMLWGFAVVSSFAHPPFQDNSTTSDSTPPYCPPLLNNDYEFEYVCSVPVEAAILGSVSLLLTVLNIICIFIMGIIVLKIKEIAPHTAMSPATEAFWKKDIPVVRNTYKTLKGRECADMAVLAKQLVAEYKMSNNSATVDTIIEDLKNDPNFTEVSERFPAESRRAFLRQLSMSPTDIPLTTLTDRDSPCSPVIDSKYHTVFSGGTAQQLVQHSPLALANHSAAAVKAHGATAGSVVRMRLRSRDCEDSTMSHSPDVTSDSELMMVDVEHLKHRRRSNRLSRAPKPSVSRFNVTTISEEQQLL